MHIELIKNTKLRAIGWMVLDCVMAASVLVIVKHSSSHLELSVLISSYHLVATILVAAIILYCGYSIKTRILYLHFVRSLMGVIAYFIYFHALSITSMANVVALGYTDGILTCLFSYIFLREHMDKVQILNLILGFTGALMIIRPDNIVNMGALLAGSAALLWALSNVLIKIIGREDKEYVQLFYSNFFTFFLASIMVIYEGSIVDMGKALEHYHLVILLAIITSVQTFALFKALNLAKAGVVMPFFVLTVVFVHIYGYVFFGEVQGLIEMLGTALVLLVGMIQIMRTPLDARH